MKKLLASVAIMAATVFAFNANASTNSTEETAVATAPESQEVQETESCVTCGRIYIYWNGKVALIIPLTCCGQAFDE